MDSILVNGGFRLLGAVRIQGSKNAALPMLAASLLTKDCNYFENCPKIADVYHMINLLEGLGCQTRWDDRGLYVDAGNAHYEELSPENGKSMRSTVFMLGAMLGSFGRAKVAEIGGCVIGTRSIDYHIDALRKMGTVFLDGRDSLLAVTSGLEGTEIALPGPSVGATENILLAAVKAHGKTKITGAAREPEVVALCEYLNSCGAKIFGAGTDIIQVEGVENLSGRRFRIPADRIVAGTYLFATVAAGGNVFLQDAPWKEMTEPLVVAERMGASCNCCGDGIYIQGPVRGPVSAGEIVTGGYPAFPTDLQSVALVANCLAKGSCTIQENLFENRFRIVEPIRSMGANIVQLGPNRVQTKGVKELHGASVEAMELRGGAALVVAGLAAKGVTRVFKTGYLDRGYENICRDLRELGARVAGV